MAIDLFSPRKALTAHLEKLVKRGVIRGVAQAESLAEVIDGNEPATHAFVYVAYDKSKDIKVQGKNVIKSTEVYTVILAFQNNNPLRTNRGHGMDDAGLIKADIEFHVLGHTLSGELKSDSTGKPFTLNPNPPEAFYRSQGWAYYPMSFDIPFTRTREQNHE